MAELNNKSLPENIINRMNSPIITPFGVYLRCKKSKFERDTGQKFENYITKDVEKLR
jgi:hypothetical protein